MKFTNNADLAAKIEQRKQELAAKKGNKKAADKGRGR